MSELQGGSGSHPRGLFGSWPLLTRLACFILAPIIVAVAAGFSYLHRSLPPEKGEWREPGLRASAQITRDASGVAHIRAQTDTDAFFALGFAHAQDRMWQLEVQRRIAAGRLSEIFGQQTLREDAWMRTLGLYAAARSSWGELSPQARSSVTSYAAGVNAWLASNPVLPVEFQILGVKPEPWSEIDSLAWTKVFALSLSGNMWREISSSIASQYLNPKQMADLLNVRGADETDPTTAGNAASLNRLQDFEGTLQGMLRFGGPYVGSNAWVVSGKLTTTGQGILANDAHLQLQIPSPWYVAALRGDRIDVAGVTLVGLPVVIFGRNRDIAWGGTAMRADNQDLYLEQPNAADPTRYRAGDGWEPFQTHVETIEVRAEFPASLRSPMAPRKIRVRATRHGPVISDAIGGVDQPIALQWAALQPHDTTYEAFYRLNYASDWSSFKDAMSHEVAPALNLLYLDRHDNIGFLGTGRIPIRSRGQGQLPVPGWNDEYRWTGYVPFEQMPQRYNPPSGYIASANDNSTDADYPYFISNDWAPPERGRRIRQLLETGSAAAARLSMADMERIQHDEIDLGAARLTRYLVQSVAVAPTEDSLRSRALAQLAAWNGEMAPDSPAAALFMVWGRHLRERLFADAVSTYWNQPGQATELKSIAAGATNDQLLHALQDPAAEWCSADAQSPRSCRELMRRSLEDAINELRLLRGGSVKSWAWGRLHETVYPHRPFSSVASLAALFERRIPNGGSPDTVNLATATYRESSGYEQDLGPSFRQLIQVSSDGWKHLYVNSTGQSGNPLSPHYDDMVKPFHDGQYFTLTTPGGDAVQSTTTITPE